MISRHRSLSENGLASSSNAPRSSLAVSRMSLSNPSSERAAAGQSRISSAGSPGTITGLVRQGAVIASGNRDMTQYLGSPGCRCKETKESQLLQHSEVMGFDAPSYPAPGFLVKLGKQLLALGLIQGHKTPVIGFLA